MFFFKTTLFMQVSINTYGRLYFLFIVQISTMVRSLDYGFQTFCAAFTFHLHQLTFYKRTLFHEITPIIEFFFNQFYGIL